MPMDKVLEFIHRRFAKNNNWTTGNCYYFAILLKTRFPQGKIMYDVIDGHFVTEIDCVKYDWNGAVEDDGKPHNYIEWKKFAEYDKLQMKTIMRDCIN